MRQRGQWTTFQTRLEISEHAAAGWNDPQIATVVGCSIWTVRKWRRRFMHQGRSSLTSHMGRPATGPTFVPFPRNYRRKSFTCASSIRVGVQPPF
jgi:hypothetical protein